MLGVVWSKCALQRSPAATLITTPVSLRDDVGLERSVEYFLEINELKGDERQGGLGSSFIYGIKKRGIWTLGRWDADDFRYLIGWELREKVIFHKDYLIV